MAVVEISDAEPVKLRLVKPLSLAASSNRWAGVCRMGGIGDNLMAASCLAGLRDQGFKVEVLSADPQHQVFENNPYVDRLIVKRREDIPSHDAEIWQQWFVNRGREYDRFVHLSHSCETISALFSGQTAFWWPALARRKLCGRSYLEIVHDIAEVPYQFGRLFWATESENDECKQIKKKIGDRCVGWCLTGSRIDKVWPSTSLAIARVISELNLPVVVFGGPGRDFELAQTIFDHVVRVNGSQEGFHFARNRDLGNPYWPIRRVLTMVQHCDVMVGPDTGPLWAAAFEPNCKIVLLSHASPENVTKHWVNTTTLHADQGRVPCWPCHRLIDKPDQCVPNKTNNGAACISDIGVDAILSAVKSKI